MWFDRLAEEHDNMRAALDWSLTADPEVGLRIAVSLVRYWRLRGHVPEEWNYLTRLIALDPSPELRARALGVMAAIAAEEGEWDDAERYVEERGRLYRELGDEEGVIRALQNVGYVAQLRGDLDRAKAVYQEVLAKVRELGMDVGIPLRTLGDVARKQGRFSDAEALYEEALAFYESIGDECAGRIRLRRARGGARRSRPFRHGAGAAEASAFAARSTSIPGRDRLGPRNRGGRRHGRQVGGQVAREIRRVAGGVGDQNTRARFLRAGRRRCARRAWPRAIRCGVRSGPCAVA